MDTGSAMRVSNLCRLAEKGLSSLLDFLHCQIPAMGGEGPAVAKGVLHGSGAVPPEHLLNGHPDLGVCFNGCAESDVSILFTKIKAIPSWLRRA